MVLITASCPMLRTSIHSSSGTLSDLLPWIYLLLPLYNHKGFDLIDRVPDELWMEVPDIVQEAGIKTIPKKKNCKKAKWLSEEAYEKTAMKRRDVKGKGEKESYTHLNAELQRIARRDKKAFLSDQCKEIEEGFLTSSCYSLELCIQMLISFFFSFAFCFSSFHSYLYRLPTLVLNV